MIIFFIKNKQTNKQTNKELIKKKINIILSNLSIIKFLNSNLK